MWKCRVCGYVYDEAVGIPGSGIAAGTKFTNLPGGWTCPVCGVGTDAFDAVRSDDIHARSVTTVADVMAAELAAWDVRLIFGLPGTSSLGLVEAVRKNRDLRYIVFRHEANAAMAASAYSKLTGKAAACLTIAGPGATNLITGLYDAKEDHASVIALNGQSEAQYTGPGGIQEIDQDALFRPVTVYNNTVASRDKAVLLLTRALKYSIVQRGVSQLSVPNNIQKEPLDAAFCTRESCIGSSAFVPTGERMTDAADRINAAKNPVIIVGWGAYASGPEILTLARTIGAPILTTFRAKGVLPEDEEWVLGILGNVGSPAARKIAEGADLLIVLGVGFSKFTNVPADRPMVQVDIDPLKLGINKLSVSLCGDCAAVIPLLLPRLQKKDAEDRRALVAWMKREWNEQRDREADGTTVPIRPPYIMKVLSEVIPEDAVIALDVGENQWWFGRNFRMKRQRFVMSGYLATMGFGFPAALAAKIAYSDHPVFCITGDGGFSMAMGDFISAVKYNLPVVVIVLNNRQLGMIRIEQMMERYPNFGTDLLNPDFAKYAEICGGAGIRVARPDELRPAIERAMAMGRPVIIDVETDPDRF